MSRSLRIPWPAPVPDPVRAGPLLAALAVHAAAAVLLWPHLAGVRERGGFVEVTLRAGERAAVVPAVPVPPGAGALAEPPAAAAAPPVTAPPPPARPHRPPPGARPPAPTAAGTSAGVFLRPAPARPGSTAAPPGVEGAVADWWSTRSAAAYVEACRAGAAPADSVLNPPPTPEQAALARTTDAFNDLAARLRGEWMLEKFLESYRENFPNMR